VKRPKNVAVIGGAAPHHAASFARLRSTNFSIVIGLAGDRLDDVVPPQPVPKNLRVLRDLFAEVVRDR
jgi:hypothetical protein